MIKLFLENFKKPEYKELDPEDQGGLAKTYSGTNEKGSKFFMKKENFRNIFRNYITHEIFAYINKGAGKTVVPIAKHYEYEVEYDKQRKDLIIKFTSSASPNASPLFRIPEEKMQKARVINDLLNSKFMIPLMLIGGGDFHGGNKIMNLRKMSGYGIDFASGNFRKSYVDSSNKYISKNKRGKIPKELDTVQYASKNAQFYGNKDKLHRYYQMLFFYHNFLKNNKRNFKKIFDDALGDFTKNIQKEYLRASNDKTLAILPSKNRMQEMIENLQYITKSDYSTFIKNLIKTIAWTEDQMKEIEKIKEKKND